MEKVLPQICDAPLVCDNQGNVYCGTNYPGVIILAFNNEGELLWQINEANQRFVYGSPAIGYNNELYYPISPNKIIAIK